MDRSVPFIPLAQYRVFLYDAQTHRFAVTGSRDADGMPEQFRSDPLMPVFGQYGKIAQFAFTVLFQEQGAISPDGPAFFLQKHEPVFPVHMPSDGGG